MARKVTDKKYFLSYQHGTMWILFEPAGPNIYIESSEGGGRGMTFTPKQAQHIAKRLTDFADASIAQAKP